MHLITLPVQRYINMAYATTRDFRTAVPYT